MREASIPVFVVVLLLVAAAASASASAMDVLPVAISTAAALVTTLAIFQLLVVVPSLRAPAAGRAVTTASTALPFALALEWSSPSGFTWPVRAVVIAFIAAALCARLGRRSRRALAGTVALLFTLVPLVESLSVASIPDADHAPTSPLGAPRAITAPSRRFHRPVVDGPSDVMRTGSLAPASLARASGFGPPAAQAPWIGVPEGVPGVIPKGSVLVRLVSPFLRRSVDGRFVVVASPELPRDARDLDAYDVVLMLGPLAPDPLGASTLESFVRRGGLLAGPAFPQSFGSDVDRALGSAAIPPEDGLRGVQTLGAGHVARVARAGGLDDLVNAGLAEPRFATVFDHSPLPPVVPFGLAAPGSHLPIPTPRVADGVIALLAAFAFTSIWASRLTPRVGIATATVLCGLATLGIRLLVDTPPTATAEAYVLDIGGRGGRRLSVLRITAGSVGWSPTTAPRSDAGLHLLGFRETRREEGEAILLLPHEVGWIVEDEIGLGNVEGLESLTTVPGWSLPLLRPGTGRASQARVFAGEGPFHGSVPAGLARPKSARTLVVLPGRP